MTCGPSRVPLPPEQRMPASLGLSEALPVGEHEGAERLIAGLRSLGIGRLRTPLAWRPDQAAWFDWLIPHLAAGIELLPVIAADDPFLDEVARRFDGCFEWIELSTLDDASRMKERGKKIVLAGDLDRLPGRSLLADAIGLSAFPDSAWGGWTGLVRGLRDGLERHGGAPEIWITETGRSTWRHREQAQLEAFLEAAAAPVDRIYWRGWQDGPEAQQERDHCFGMLRADGSAKLLHRCLAKGGVPEARAVAALRSGPAVHAGEKPVVITGGAGFLGTNIADSLLRQGRKVLVYDNLSRPGVEENLAWLQAEHKSRLGSELGDVRDPQLLREAVGNASAVYHLAAQVAVTTSLVDPETDFEINLRGTFNLLEALRRRPTPPPLVFASTNKVYGALGDLPIVAEGQRWLPEDQGLRQFGVAESQPLDLHSPYGCSKGGADQYVVDYARIFELPATVFRMSCLYGPHQHGTEDQGWVAHFLISALSGSPITIYGDGRQVRDVLYVDDVVDAYLRAVEHMGAVRGRAFNIGGGPANAISLRDLLSMVEQMNGVKPQVEYGPWRPGDQLYYVTDTRRFQQATGWRPAVPATEGVAKLNAWLKEKGRVLQEVSA